MRTTHAFLACAMALVAVAPLALTDCSGSGSSKVTAGEDAGGHSGSGGGASSGGGAESSSGGGEDAGANGSSSSGGEGASSSGAGGDGGVGIVGDGATGSSGGGMVIPVPEGGAPSTPGMVTCGSTTCTTSSNECCASPDGGGGSCIAYNGACTGGVTQACDEAADCTGGAVCCQTLACGTNASSCKATCGEGDFQPCRTDSECGLSTDAGAAQKCVVQTCSSLCQGEHETVEACAYPTTTGEGFATTTTWGALPGCTAN